MLNMTSRSLVCYSEANTMPDNTVWCTRYLTCCSKLQKGIELAHQVIDSDLLYDALRVDYE